MKAFHSEAFWVRGSISLNDWVGFTTLYALLLLLFLFFRRPTFCEYMRDYGHYAALDFGPFSALRERDCINNFGRLVYSMGVLVHT